MRLFIPVIIGTTRPKRQSIKVAHYLKGQLADRENVTTQLVDPTDYDLTLDGNDQENKIGAYSELIERADGLMIVVPEYNHSFPGSLKSLLDKELGAYFRKPAAIAGVSGGGFGGVRAIESLVPVLRELGMVVSSIDMPVPKVAEAFNEEGGPIDERIQQQAGTTIEELVWLAHTLKAGRNQEK